MVCRRLNNPLKHLNPKEMAANFAFVMYMAVSNRARDTDRKHYFIVSELRINLSSMH